MFREWLHFRSYLPDLRLLIVIYDIRFSEKEGFQVPGTFSLAFLFLRSAVRELRVVVDKSGGDGFSSRYYLLAVVMHVYRHLLLWRENKASI